MKKSRVTGARKLRRLLQRAPDDIAKGVKEALEESAEELLAEMQNRVPVREGDLRDSIRKWKRSNGLVWNVGFSKKAQKRAWKKAGWRAHYVEFGTKGYMAGTRTKHGKMARRRIPARQAQPFMRPALMSVGPRVLKRIDKSVHKALVRLSNV